MTLKASVGQESVSGFDGFIRATLTMRQSELGSQARTEGGFIYRWNNNEVGLVVGREENFYCATATGQCAVKGGGAFIMPLRFGRN